jgi:SNF family Na+-dependent transporter
LLMALFVGYVVKKSIVQNELGANEKLVELWFIIIKVLSPLLLILIFIQGII